MSRVELLMLGVVCLALSSHVCAGTQARAAEPPTGGDLFDVDRATTVTDHSGVTSSIVEALLGAPGGGPEPGIMFFADGSAGTVHFVEWRTAAPVTLEGFNVHAIGDVPGTPERRTFNHFRLQAKVGQDYVTLYDEDVVVPYEFVDGQFYLAISAPVTPTTAADFRAEFTQHLEGQFYGPRVVELDGFPAAFCGDANYDQSITATDALTALRAGVSLTGCPRCVCDVDSGGSVAASDALSILVSGVGLPATLDCPGCFGAESPTTTSPTSMVPF